MALVIEAKKDIKLMFISQRGDTSTSRNVLKGTIERDHWLLNVKDGRSAWSPQESIHKGRDVDADGPFKLRQIVLRLLIFLLMIWPINESEMEIINAHFRLSMPQHLSAVSLSLQLSTKHRCLDGKGVGRRVGCCRRSRVCVC